MAPALATDAQLRACRPACRLAARAPATRAEKPLSSRAPGRARFIVAPAVRGWQMRRAGSNTVCHSSNAGVDHKACDVPDELRAGEAPAPAFGSVLFGLALPLAAVGGGLMGTGFDLSGPESVAQALGVLALIVAVHEAGHFSAARLQSIHVSKFSIGFGPTLVKFQRDEVEYSLRAFPLGGFVAFPDEEEDSKFDEDDPDLLRNRPILDRAIVISAGVLANFVFAYAILFAQVSTVGVGSPEYLPGVKIPEIVRGSVAERSGLRAGDIIEAVNSAPVLAQRGEVNRIVREIKQSDGKAMQFEILRDGERQELTIIPELAEDGYGRIGVQLVNNSKINRTKASSVGEAAALAGQQWVQLTGTITSGLTQIFSNFQQSAKDVSGPIAIVAVGAEVARNDSAGLFQFAALVNLNLAVVNLLPLPALDGGYLALLALEALRGQKLEKQVEGAIMGSGLVLLMGSGLFLVLRDALNLVK